MKAEIVGIIKEEDSIVISIRCAPPSEIPPIASPAHSPVVSIEEMNRLLDRENERIDKRKEEIGKYKRRMRKFRLGQIEVTQVEEE